MCAFSLNLCENSKKKYFYLYNRLDTSRIILEKASVDIYIYIFLLKTNLIHI